MDAKNALVRANGRSPLLLALCALASLLLLSPGCANPTPTPTPTKTPKPPATPTPPPPPTLTPTPTLTPISVVVATPTPQPTLPADVCPLTGEKVNDPKHLERRPLAVKISNFPPIVRPQAGLSFADVVFEHYVEKGLTRFTAIFLSRDAEKVGSIRSARLIDLEIVPMFKAIFAYSGSSWGIKQKIIKSDFADRVLSPDFGDPGFRRIPAPGKAFEHTLFSDTKTLWQIAEERGLNARQDLSGWEFSEKPPRGGKRATKIEIVYKAGYASAEYEYDPQRGAYLRYVLGEPHLDELTEEQIAVTNVVVVYAEHEEVDVLGGTPGPPPRYSTEIRLRGEGRAVVFRDGRAFEGQWVRRRRDLIRFVDEAGHIIPLKPGNTWIQVVPLDFEIEYE